MIELMLVLTEEQDPLLPITDLVNDSDGIVPVALTFDIRPFDPNNWSGEDQ